MMLVQNSVLDFLEDPDESDITFLDKCLEDQKIKTNKCDMNTFLHLISIISENHHRSQDFINKIEQIILNIKSDIQKFFSNLEIFHIFEKNKRILLFLFENQILIQEEKVLIIIQKRHPDYIPYLFPKNSSDYFLNKKIFDQKRKNGENDSYICELIRKDSVEEFDQYRNSNLYPLNSKIPPSIFETNPIFLKKDQNENPKSVTLIEYAAFYGSIQIFRYLMMNNVELTPSLFIYAIHSENAELIHILESYLVDQEKNYDNVLIESIKCHHRNVTMYLDENYITNKFFFLPALKYYNFSYICEYKYGINKTNSLNGYVNTQCIKKKNEDTFQIDDIEMFIAFVKYDYIKIVRYLLNDYKKLININFYVKDSILSFLYVAVKKENYEIIKLILSCNDVDVNKISKIPNKSNTLLFSKRGKYETPLLVAIRNYNSEIVDYILGKKNVNLNVESIDKPILSVAFECGQKEVINKLLCYVNLGPVAKLIEEKKYNESLLYISYYLNNCTYVTEPSIPIFMGEIQPVSSLKSIF